MRIITYRDGDDWIRVGTESDEGTHGELAGTFPGTVQGEFRADNFACALGDKVGAPVYAVRQDGRLLLIQRVQAEREAERIPLTERENLVS